MNISGNKFQPSTKISKLVKHGLKEMDALWTPDVDAPEAAIAKGEEYLVAISRQSDTDEIKKFAGYARKLAHSAASGASGACGAGASEPSCPAGFGRGLRR